MTQDRFVDLMCDVIEARRKIRFPDDVPSTAAIRASDAYAMRRLWKRLHPSVQRLHTPTLKAYIKSKV